MQRVDLFPTHEYGGLKLRTGPDFSWHGVKAWRPDCCYNNLTAAFMLNGQYADSDGTPDDFIYVAMNMHWDMHGFELPQLPEGMAWHVFANTAMTAPLDICEPGEELPVENQGEVLVDGRSVMILVGRSRVEKKCKKARSKKEKK